MNEANPKDAAGRAKVPLHLWPASATAAGAMGFLEGMLKYGRNNFRATPVAASVYVAAAKRHLDGWMEGADTAADTENLHLGNALACIAILVDAQVNGTLIDDRNFVPDEGAYERFVASLAPQVAHLQELFAGRDPKHWDARDHKDMQRNTARSFAFDTNQAATFGPLGTDAKDPLAAPREGPCDCPRCVGMRNLKQALEGNGIQVVFLGESSGLTD